MFPVTGKYTFSYLQTKGCSNVRIVSSFRSEYRGTTDAAVVTSKNHADMIKLFQVNCTYLRPAPEGAKVFVESWVVHLGKRMGLTRGAMRLDSEDGKVLYSCEHGKATVGSPSL